jgi:mutator protein MutT
MIHVVCAALIDAAGRILIAQRPAGKHLAGGWEFPGGKVEPGETRVAALARELNEELGIVVWQPRPLLRLRHAYPHGEVLLDVWVVRRYAGEPRGLDGQQLHWCTQDELANAELLPADAPIVAALRLPERLQDRSSDDYTIAEWDSVDRALLPADSNVGTRLQGALCAGEREALQAVARGADFLVLRATLSAAALEDLCAAVDQPVYAQGLRLEEAWRLGATGISEMTS